MTSAWNTSRGNACLGIFSLATLCLILAAESRADEPAAARTLVRVGEVEGRTFNEDRSSFDARGLSFVTMKDKSGVRVWDAITLKPITEPLVHGSARGFVISGDGQTVVTYDLTEVRIWDVATSTVRAVIRLGLGNLEFAEISPDGSRVLSIDKTDPDYISLWRVGAGEPRLEKKLAHRGRLPVASAQFDPTATRIVSYRDSNVASSKIHNPDGEFDIGSPVETDKEFWYPYAAKVDPRGGQYAMPMYRDFIIVDCETGTRSIKSRYKNNGTYPTRLYFSADGSRISTVIDGAVKGECQSYDANTGKFQHAFAHDMTTCRLFGPHGKLAICDDYSMEPNRPAELWDIDAGRILQTIPDEQPVEPGPDGKTVLFEKRTKVGPFDSLIRQTTVWRLRD